jgi:hypothetical protein
MEAHDFTAEEMASLGEFFAGLDQAKAHLEAVARRLEEHGYRERAHKTRGAAQVVDGQKYLLVLDWKDRRKAA